MSFSRISLIFLILVGLDQLSKILITSVLDEGASIPFTAFFRPNLNL